MIIARNFYFLQIEETYPPSVYNVLLCLVSHHLGSAWECVWGGALNEKVYYITWAHGSTFGFRGVLDIYYIQDLKCLITQIPKCILYFLAIYAECNIYSFFTYRKNVSTPIHNGLRRPHRSV